MCQPFLWGKNQWIFPETSHPPQRPIIHEFTPSHTALIIDFWVHKTNKLGIYCGKVECFCSCQTGICPDHTSFNFIAWKKRKYGDALNDPLLIRLNEKPLSQSHINFCIKNLIYKMSLNPDHHSSHSLRSGSNWLEALKQAWFIKKWGRWRSDVWHDFHVKLDFTDNAKLSNESLHQLCIVDNASLDDQL